MGNKHLIVAMSSVLVLAGCSASVNGTVTSPTGSTGATTTGGASTGTNASTSTGANVSASASALTAVYKVGNKYTYNLTTAGVASTMSWEVTDVSNNKATIKTSVSVLGSTQTNTQTIDLTGSSQNPYGGLNLGASSAANANGQVTTSTESVTVPAGTYSCTKVHTANPDGSSSDVWYNNTVGLVKESATAASSANSQASAAAAAAAASGLGNIPGLSGAASGSASALFSLELASISQ